jgi:(p)ppGpp synthase/HD superfamily hydrolase
MEDLVTRAREYAINKHDNPAESQRYGTKPYSYHLQMVVDNVMRYKYLLDDNVHEDVIAAAWNHDCVEDSDATPKILKQKFNERVANIVHRVSNERGWDNREILFKTLPKIWQCELATFVKLCDRIANGKSSKEGFDDKSKRTYQRYISEYPIFRYALKTENLYDEMWKELDEIFDFKVSKDYKENKLY